MGFKIEALIAHLDKFKIYSPPYLTRDLINLLEKCRNIADGLSKKGDIKMTKEGICRMESIVEDFEKSKDFLDELIKLCDKAENRNFENNRSVISKFTCGFIAFSGAFINFLNDYKWWIISGIIIGAATGGVGLVEITIAKAGFIGAISSTAVSLAADNYICKQKHKNYKGVSF